MCYFDRMTSLTLHHRDILPADCAVHLARATLLPTRPKVLHGHDFYELFWVQNGKVRHHLPNGAETLNEGDIVCLAPGNTHALQGRGEHALIVSLCLHPDLIAVLPTRHPRLAGHLFWGETPHHFHRDSHALAALNQAALRLERSPRDALAAEAFLLPLCADVGVAPVPVNAPGWLKTAIGAVQNPRVFRNGAAGLVAASGQTHPHVSRTMKRIMGISPSEYVNRLRMVHAAEALAGTGDPLADIATDCGIPNLSHFHKVFRAHHGVTPAQFRQRNQRHVVQPV